MKAMVLIQPAPVTTKPLVSRDLPEPQAGPGEVRIRVSACGVCHTDLHIVEGELRSVLPIIPGHQIVGIIDQVGTGSTGGAGGAGPEAGGGPHHLTGLAPGTRVGFPWLYSSCGVCGYCRRGEENLCESARFTGLHHDGGYAEYVVVPAGFVVPLPDSFADVEAAPLLCAGIIGYRSLKVSGLQPGERLALFGFGASAHIAIQIARFWGCEVAVFTRSKKHKDMAIRLGAAWAGSAGETPPFLADRAVTFAPAGSLIPEALKVLRKGGALAINAVHLEGVPAFPYDLLYWERSIKSVANATRRDAEEFVNLAARIPVQTEVQTFALDEANEALIALKQGAINGAAVLLIRPRA
ncbi:MAG: zinc-dependent alcohol dehydrogenase family protein [Firmicutes bacterium]|nr:zinc-dependent alcohol dehydrogenase family protein [Bacillota bacterium]